MDAAFTNTLAAAPLFRNMERGEIDRLLSAFPGTVKAYHKGSIIAFRGDDYRDLLLLASGEISAELHSHAGKILRIETIAAPAPLAGGILFADEPFLPVTVVALTDVSVLRISRKNLLGMMRENGTFLLNFLSDMGNKIVFLADKIALFQFRTIRQKLCGYLLDLCARQGSWSVRLPYSKEALSELFGVTRPSLSRVFAELESERMIVFEGRMVHILDLEAVREEIEPAEGDGRPRA